MDLMLGWLIIAVVLGALLWVVIGPFIRNPGKAAAEWVTDFRDTPISTSCALLAVVGVVPFFGTALSFGQLAFDVPTPWGPIKSFWLGGMLALLSIPGFFLRRGERRRRRRSERDEPSTEPKP